MSMNEFETALSEWEKSHALTDKDAPAGRTKKKQAVAGPLVIDLHGKTKEESGRILERAFLDGGMKSGTVVHVIHGVGRHSSENKKVLKPFVKEWLSGRAGEFKQIRPGKPGEGSAGVTVVVVK